MFGFSGVWNWITGVFIYREDTQYYGVREVKVAGGGIIKL